MKKMFKLTTLLAIAALLAMSALSCQSGGDNTDAPKPSDTPVSVVLSDDGISADNTAGLAISESTVTVNAPGTYKFTGSLSDGNIVVDTLEKGDVFLVLAGVDIHCSSISPIYGKQAKNIYIVLEEGTENYISDENSYILPAGEDEPDAAIFSKDDLFILGEGSLFVDANYNDGITGKDDVNIESGNITVDAVNHGIKGKDSLEIKGGKVTVTALGDGLKSTQDNDATLGFVEIKAGEITIKAGDEGIQAYTNVIISGGNISIDSVDGAVKAEQTITVSDGVLVIKTYDSAFSAIKIEGNDRADVTVDGKKYEF